MQQALTDEEPHLFDVVGGADHQLPGLVLVVIGEGQSLDLGIQIISQVIGDGLGILLGPKGLQEGKDAADGGKDDNSSDGPQQ